MKPKPKRPFAKAPKRTKCGPCAAKETIISLFRTQSSEYCAKFNAAEADKRKMQLENLQLQREHGDYLGVVAERDALAQKIKEVSTASYDAGFKNAVNCKCSLCLARKAELRYAAKTLNEMQYSESKDRK